MSALCQVILALALGLSSVSARAANVAGDEIERERAAIELCTRDSESARHVIRLATLCMMQHAATEERALIFARSALRTCVAQNEVGCGPVRAYILGRWLEASRDPVEAFAGFRRVRIPRVHGVQRLSISNARFKHMRDASAQKEAIGTGTGSVHGKSDWVWGYDPVADWDKEPVVPTAYAA